MPFTDIEGNDQLRVQLEQLPEGDFRLIHGFRYEVPGSTDVYVVPDGQETDLASVPFFLAWFISAFGRHTLAAILHDYLWRERRQDVPLRAANLVFRTALYELKLPFVRRWLMWTAVSLAAVMMKGPIWRARAVLWVAAILGLDVLTVWVWTRGVGPRSTALIVACLVATLALLLPHMEITAVGAPTVYMLIPAIVLVLATTLLYLAIERVSFTLGIMWRHIAPRIRRPVPAPINPPAIDKTTRQRADSYAMVRGVLARPR